LRIKEQETRLNLHDDDDDYIFDLYVYVTICLCAGMHYKIKSCWRRNYSEIISNVSAFISPIRLRSIAGDLAGALAGVSGWSKSSDSKYNFLIISQFYFKIFTYQNDCFKGEETYGLQKILWSLLIPSIYSMIRGV